MRNTGPVPIDQKILVTPDEAAALLSISRDTLERSDVPWVKLGRLRRYDPEQLRAYISARRSHEVGA